MLIVLGVWRYLICGLPFAYDPLSWGGGFPLGMYSVSTYWLTEIMEAPFLTALSTAFMIIALAAWLLTFVGFIDSRMATAPVIASRSMTQVNRSGVAAPAAKWRGRRQ